MQAYYGNPTARRTYRLALHLALIAGAIMFSMPFVWMLSTSLKEDDEQMTADVVWIPRLPPYRPQGPYLDEREGEALVQPREVSDDWWRQLQPAVSNAMDAALAAAAVPAGATPAPQAHALLRAAVWRDIQRQIPSPILTDPAESTREALLKARRNGETFRPQATIDEMRYEQRRKLAAEIARLATPEQIRKTHTRLYRVLALRAVSLRSVGQSAVTIPAHADSAAGAAEAPASLVWQSTPELRLETAKNAGGVEDQVHYSFTESGKRAVLTTVVPYGALDTLKTVSVSMAADASWNRLWFALEFDGRRYEAQTPYLLAGKRGSEAFIQLPSPDDDDDLRIRDWIATRRIPGTGFHQAPGTVKIEVALENTGTLVKAYDKSTNNYRQALRYIPFWRYTLTSLLLVALNVVLAIFSSSLIAFSFARLRWPGQGLCWAVLLGTVMIPGQVTMIPYFLIMKWLGWFNTLRPLWVGSAFGSVFFIFMLRQFMKNIPRDLEDAAKIDGCSFWRIYWHVALPLVKPTLAAVGIFTFMGTWNDFIGPLMFLSDQRYYPLSLGLFAFQTVAGGNQGMMMAASLLMTLPVIALFFVAQKQFIQGVTFTGIKG